ncbi:protein transporter SEC24 [Hysterangium stoloniferum]|nr:protein transporter SEC24 [Hysterangium stoloniferum]
METPPNLPPGWAAQWDSTHQRHLFIESATGRSQWEHPAQFPAAPVAPIDAQPQGQPQPAGTSGKRRQYATGQTQAYYGTPDTSGAQYADAAYAAGQPAQAGGQLFTPGLLAEQGGFQAQQQAPYYAPQEGYANGQYPQQPDPAAPAHQVNQMTNQFAQMGMGQKPFQFQTVNLLSMQPDPRDLHRPPPEIRLPPNATVSPSPSANADPSYKRSTINAVPTTSSLLNKSKVPFALIITPHRTLKEGDEAVPVVSDTVIARCRRCRTYINPYVQFIDGGNRWKCCMCSMSNEVPQLFDWDQARNAPGDRWARAELNHSVVEFIAPTEYMVRPPQPPVYAFLIDVSHAAVQSGMVATATRTILESLDRIPNEDNRTKIAIIAFDVALYFFSLAPGQTETSMLVVSDLDDVFLPKPTDLLVNLTESRGAIEALLGRISDMFQDSHTVGSAMGPALQAGFKMIQSIGGKLMVLSASLPTLGAGALKSREDPKILGTSKESSLLQAASPFYKTFAIECSRAQVSVDMFLFASGYTDIASLSCLPHYTSGQTYFYPAFNAARSEDALKFAHEFGTVLSSPICFEAVMRVRASKGLRMSEFHGNFFVRSTDLLAMPSVPVDQSYAIEVQIEETITAPFVVLQTATLHTTAFGERRIRVVNLALPTTSSMSELYSSVDEVALATLLANKAVERTISHKLEDARDAITNKLIDIMTTYKGSMTAAGSGASSQLAISDNMKMLPLLCLGLLKHVGIRQSAQIPSDLRAYAEALLTTLPSQLLVPFIHPTFYSLHNMPPEAGTVGEQGIILPPPLPLTSERLERHGLFLIEDGQTIFLWVGRDAVPQLVQDVFNLPSYDQLRGGKITLPLLDNPFSQRVNAIIAKTREMRRGPYWPHLYVVKEDGEAPLRLWALSGLIMDRAEQMPSYQQYLGQVRDKVNGSSY